MNRLTNEQRLQIIEFYYQNQCSVRNVFRALRPIYGLHNRPSEQTINAIVTKFRTQFTLLDIKPTTRMRTVRTEENIASVSESVAEDREMSIRRRSQQLGLSYSTTWKILRKDLVQNIQQREESTIGMEKFGLPKRLQGSKPSVWNEYITLALQYKPLNLGQGFPDELPPSYVTDALADIAKSENPMLQQYTRGYGHVRLVQALSKLYSKLVDREVNPLSEILITSGAYEALYSAIMGHIDVGDEVIIIEPFFDCYEPMVKMAGGVPRFIALKPNKSNGTISSADWVLDDAELEQVFNNKTKMIILNTPHNPIGKVFHREELERIAALCRKWNVLCLSDEVYEWMVYDDAKHIRICTLPGMWERTITIGSAGKTFSVTGWKIGWAYGPSNLITNLQMVHQNSVYTCPTPIQEAVAIGFELELTRLESPDCYFNSLPQELKVKRDFMAKFLQDAGLKPTIPEGGYFMLADWSNLGNKIDLSSEADQYLDYKFTKWMTKNMGLQGIPPSAFYGEDHKKFGENFVRYCFIKKQENLEKAAELLKKWKA